MGATRAARRWRRCLPKFTSTAPVATSAGELAELLPADAAEVLAAVGPVGVGVKLYGRPPRGLRDRLPREIADALADAGLSASTWLGDGAWLTAHVYIGRGATGRTSVLVEVELFLSVPAEVVIPATRRRPARTKPGRRTLARMRTQWKFPRRERRWVPGCIAAAWIDAVGGLLARQRTAGQSDGTLA